MHFSKELIPEIKHDVVKISDQNWTSCLRIRLESYWSIVIIIYADKQSVLNIFIEDDRLNCYSFLLASHACSHLYAFAHHRALSRKI